MKQLVIRGSSIPFSLSLCFSLLALMVPSGLQAQWYGQKTYSHDSTVLCDAKRTVFDPGYVMAGFRLKRQWGSGLPDFVIQKTDVNGQFTSANDFSNEYQLLSNNCVAGSPTYRCFGLEVIETNNTVGAITERYALAVSDTLGVYFATLDNTGAVVRQLSWVWPQTNPTGSQLYMSPNMSHRPSICESTINPNTYYIAGSFREDSAYVISIDASVNPPVVNWSNFYSAWKLDPNDIIESPHVASADVIVVGRCDPGGTMHVTPPTQSAADAFFMSLNPSTGAVNTFSLYHTQYHGDEWFSSINTAHNGFILSGRSHFPMPAPPAPQATTNANYPHWMCNLDASGGINWTSLIESPYACEPNVPPDFPIAGPGLSGAVERQNTSGNYEYYGVGEFYCDVTAGGLTDHIIVYKLDDNGQDSHSPDEFHYLPAHTEQEFAASYSQITTLDTTANPVSSGEGLQVFGTTSSVTAHYMIKSYFNGYSGCNENITDIANIHQGPDSILTRQVATSNFGTCPGNITFSVTSSNSGSTLCSAQSIGSGDNSKIVSINSTQNTLSYVFPNPSSQFLNLSEGISQVKIMDLFGRTLYETTFTDFRGSQIDLRKTGMIPGQYFIRFIANGEQFNRSFILLPE